jgi:hypothetical protein
MQSMHADAEISRIGALTSVEVVGVKPNSLAGRVVASASHRSSAIVRSSPRRPLI